MTNVNSTLTITNDILVPHIGKTSHYMTFLKNRAMSEGQKLAFLDVGVWRGRPVGNLRHEIRLAANLLDFDRQLVGGSGTNISSFVQPNSRLTADSLQSSP
jgi:hypothetical protein